MIRLSRSRSRVSSVAVGLVLVTGLGGCSMLGGDDPAPSAASYTPVPDDRLFDEISALPHVRTATISFRDTPTDGRLYSGRLETDGEENPYAVLDAATAVLRQGRPRAQILVTVAADPTRGVPREYTSTEILDRSQPDPLTARYGPQPGDGTPPVDDPAPVAPGWTAPPD